MRLQAPSFTVDVENFALITYKVPAARVLRHLPGGYTLQTFDDEDHGGRYCFVSSSCFCNRNYRLTGLPYPRHTFNESTHRTYVDYGGRNATYFFGRFLGTPLALVSQRTAARDTYRADFEVNIARGEGGYSSYSCNATGSEGEASFVITATERPEPQPPFESGEALAQFLTYRLSGLFTTSVGTQGHMPVSHRRMDPWAGTLSAGRFTLWEDLEILDRDEALSPYSVLVTEEVRFRLYLPRPG